MVLDGLRILFFQSTFPKKCKDVVRTYGAIQLAYAEVLENADDITEFQCNVMLTGLEIREYMFVVK